MKDERHLDQFDRVFRHLLQGAGGGRGGAGGGRSARRSREEWLRKLAEKLLTAEERAQIQSLGGFEELMKTLRERLAEQQGRHQGGSKWIGTAGDFAVRRLWLQPGGGTDRAGWQPPPPGDQGVGQAGIPRPG